MEIEKFLREKGIKITKGRLAIYNIIKESKSSVNAEYIFSQCKKNSIKVNLSTVYRTIDIFESSKIIDKIILDDGKFYYKLKKKEHKHILKCDLCNKEIEIDCPMKSISEIVQNETGFTLTEHQLVMRGVCDKCKKREKNCNKICKM